MPDDDVTIGEVARSVERMRRDLAEQFNGINARLDGFVSAQVHASDIARLDLRADTNAEDIRDLRQAQERDRHTARTAKQWSIGVGISALGVLLGMLTLLRAGDGASVGTLAELVRMMT